MSAVYRTMTNGKSGNAFSERQSSAVACLRGFSIIFTMTMTERNFAVLFQKSAACPQRGCEAKKDKQTKKEQGNENGI